MAEGKTGKVMFLDIDDTLLDAQFSKVSGKYYFTPQHPKLPEFLAQAKEKGIKLVLVTTRGKSDRAATLSQLKSAGFDSSLFDGILEFPKQMTDVAVDFVIDKEKALAKLANADFLPSVFGGKEFGEFWEKASKGVIEPQKFIQWKSYAVAKAFLIDKYMKEHGISPRNAIMIGNLREVDIHAARLAGIQHQMVSRKGESYNRIPGDEIKVKRRVSFRTARRKAEDALAGYYNGRVVIGKPGSFLGKKQRIDIKRRTERQKWFQKKGVKRFVNSPVRR